MSTLIFDIETGPRSNLLETLPPFDPTAVKCGNIKDPLKIQAKIKESEENYYQDIADKAALHPMLGEILAIGCELHGTGGVQDGQFLLLSGDPRKMLEEFWQLCTEGFGPYRNVVGWGIHTFDLRWLYQHSIKYGVTMPPNVIVQNRYWNNAFIDLKELWKCGERFGESSPIPVGLDSVSRFLGAQGKNGDGADFAVLWKTEQQKAIEYLKNDVVLTRYLAQSMNCL